MLLAVVERGDDLLALFLDIPREAGVALLDKSGCQAQLEQGNRETCGEIVEIRACFRELHRFTRLIAELFQRLEELLVKQIFHAITSNA